jgi:hypothetical protein
MENNNNNNQLIEQYLRKLISEELTKKNRDSFISQVLRMGKQLGISLNSNLIILRDVLLALVPKLVTDYPYSKPERDKIVRAINQIFIGNIESPGTTLQPKWENEQQMMTYINSEFPNGMVGSIIQDYAGYKYKVWKFNKPAMYIHVQSLDDGKVYWVDTEEMLKGFIKL